MLIVQCFIEAESTGKAVDCGIENSDRSFDRGGSALPTLREFDCTGGTSADSLTQYAVPCFCHFMLCE